MQSVGPLPSEDASLARLFVQRLNSALDHTDVAVPTPAIMYLFLIALLHMLMTFYLPKDIVKEVQKRVCAKLDRLTPSSEPQDPIARKVHA
jgi:hypothetical protein